MFSLCLCAFIGGFFFFFFNDTATTEIYTLSHTTLFRSHPADPGRHRRRRHAGGRRALHPAFGAMRSEEHTSELQSRLHLVCRLLLEKKKTKHYSHIPTKRNITKITHE